MLLKLILCRVFQFIALPFSGDNLQRVHICVPMYVVCVCTINLCVGVCFPTESLYVNVMTKELRTKDPL